MGVRSINLTTHRWRGNYGFLRTLEPGKRNHRIRRCVNSPLKRKAGDFGRGERKGYRAGFGIGPGLFLIIDVMISDFCSAAATMRTTSFSSARVML